MKRVRIKSIYVRMILSMSILIILPIIFSAVMGYHANDRIVEKVNKTNHILLSHFKKSTDGILDEMTRLRMKTINNNRLIQMIGFSYPLSSEERWSINNFVEELNQYTFGYDYLYEYYVYIESMESIVGARNFRSTKDFYVFDLKSDNYTYLSWLDLLKRRHNRYFVEDHKLIYITTLPIYSGRDLKGNVYQSIDTERVLAMSIVNDTELSGDFFVLSQNNAILYRSKYFDTTLDFKGFNFGDTNNMLYTNSDGKAYYIAFDESDVSRFKYVYAISKDELDLESKRFSLILLLGMLIYLLLGIVVGYLTIRGNYRPISKIINRLNKNKVSGVNEFEVIDESIKLLLSDYNDALNLISKQDQVYHKEYLKKRLSGSDNIHEPKSNTFLYDHFLVGIIIINEIDASIFNQQNNELVQFVIQNIWNECLLHMGTIHLVEYKQLLVGIVNYESLKGNEDYARIIDGLKQGLGYMDDELGLSLTLVLSEAHVSKETISIAYEEAVEILDFKYILGAVDIIEYTSIKSRLKSNKTLGLDEVEIKLKKWLKKGDVQHAIKEADLLFDQCFKTDTISPRQVRLFLMQLNGMLIRLFDYLNVHMEDEIFDKLNWFDEKLHHHSYLQVKKDVIDMIQLLGTINKDTTNEFIIGIHHYIKSKYMNPNLNISIIGDEFGMNPFYISKLYKEEFGEGILETIMNIRIHEAKKLLKDYNVETVARKVGYSNVRSFTRGFKKVTNTTPGKFKKDIQ